MSKEQNGTGPELIVLGHDDSGTPRAGRFSAGQANLVAKAAKAMNLTVCKADGEALTDLAKKLQIGRLYATGRAFVPTVRRGIYDKLVEQLRLAGQQVPSDTDAPSSGDQAGPGLPATWNDIAVGHLVIAQESHAAGWWEALVLARDGDMLKLQWRDFADWPTFVRHAGAVALLKPSPAKPAPVSA
jgi:hypothetical protein